MAIDAQTEKAFNLLLEKFTKLIGATPTEREIKKFRDSLLKFSRENIEYTDKVKALEHVIDDLEAEITSTSLSFQKLSKILERQGPAAAFEEAKVGIGSFVSSLHSYVKDIGSKTMETLIGGGTFVVLRNIFDEQVNTYRDLVNVGQTFGGSILSMSTAAAQAGVPLEEFAKLVKENSQAFASLGMPGMSNLIKSVRETGYEFGNFGFTTEQLNGLLSNYARAQVLLGIANRKNSMSLASGFESLIGVSQALANATGASRDQLLKFASDIVTTDETVVAHLLGIPEAMRGQATASIQAAAMGLAAVFGQNSPLVKGMTDTMALHNVLVNSDIAQMNAMTGGVLGQGLQHIQDLTDQHASQQAILGATYDYIDSLRHLGANTLKMLEIQSLSGNAQAKMAIQAISAANAIKATREEFIKSQIQDQKFTDMTTAMMNLQAKLKDLYSKVAVVLLPFITLLGYGVTAINFVLNGLIKLNEAITNMFGGGNLGQIIAAAIDVGFVLVGTKLIRMFEIGFLKKIIFFFRKLSPLNLFTFLSRGTAFNPMYTVSLGDGTGFMPGGRGKGGIGRGVPPPGRARAARVGRIRGAVQGLARFGSRMLGWLKPMIPIIGAFFGETLLEAAGTALTVIGGLFTGPVLIAAAIGAAVAGIAYLAYTFRDEIWGFIKSVWGGITDIFWSGFSIVKNALKSLAKGVTDIAGAIADGVMGVVNWFIGLPGRIFSWFWDKIKSIFSGGASPSPAVVGGNEVTRTDAGTAINETPIVNMAAAEPNKTPELLSNISDSLGRMAQDSEVQTRFARQQSESLESIKKDSKTTARAMPGMIYSYG